MKKPMNRPEYLEWSKTLTKNECMLCEYKEHQIVLKEWEHWVLVYSVAPYKKYNMMLVPKRHSEFMHEINDLEWFFLKQHMRWCYGMFATINDVSEFIWLWRTRDTNFGITKGVKLGKRLNHLHLHFMPEATRWLDPILDPDAANEEVFNKVVEACNQYGKRSQ
jgi:diadenosine tetraphosphate (Ap4A) HIT family hydrolase